MRAPRAAWRRGALAAVLVAAAILVASCDTVPLLAPSGSTLVVQAGATIVATGGTTQISATVLESAGTPVPDGTTVQFTTTLGTLDPATAQTVAGVARTTFRAGSSSGLATIRATSGQAGSAANEGTTTAVVEVSVGAAAISSLTVGANPGRVAFGGGTVEIVATARGQNGEELANVLVQFSSDEGTLASASALTDASGRATTQLVTDRTTVVTATVGSQFDTVTVAGTSVSTLTLGVNPGFVLGSGGTVNVVARVLDSEGQGLAGVPVFFSSDQGTLGSASITTDSTGTGTTTLQTTQTTVVTATAAGKSATVTVARRENTITNVVITATAGTVTAGVGHPYTFATTVSPSSDSSQVVRFEWDFGDGTTVTSQSGTLAHVFTSNGVYTVTVQVTLQDGRQATGQTQVVAAGI